MPQTADRHKRRNRLGELCLKAFQVGAEWQSYTDALAADPNFLTNYEALNNRLISEQNRRLSLVEEKALQ